MSFIKKEISRQLRKEDTATEKIVWQYLRNRKFKFLKFRRQHVISGFVVDFYCHKLKLAIEIDGEIHRKQKDYDTFRQKLIEEEHIRFIRVTNKEIYKDIDILLNQIEALSQQKI